VQNHWRARKFFGSAMPADVEEFSPAIQNGRRKRRESHWGEMTFRPRTAIRCEPPTVLIFI
jgi:hypothetical protein